MKARFSALAVTAVFLAVSGQAAADGDYHKIQAAAQAKVSPEQAIGTAEKQAGGQATDIQLEAKYGNPVYKVETRNGNQEHTVYVDAVSGKVLGNKTEMEWKPLQPASVSLERAIRTAQSRVGGRVMEAERETSRGQVVYKVEILSADKVPHKVVVDADSGKVLASYVDYDD